jgi:hypothetical protein
MACGYALRSSLAAAALAGAAIGPVQAQCRLCSAPTTELQQSEDGSPIRIEVQTTLDFDRLVLLSGGTGTATLLPTGERSATGALGIVSASAMVGTVNVRGEANRTLRVELPPRIELYSLRGAKIVIDELQTDLPSLPRLDAAGNLSFHFGGRLHISGEAEGDYRGDVPITVEYL